MFEFKHNNNPSFFDLKHLHPLAQNQNKRQSSPKLPTDDSSFLIQDAMTGFTQVNGAARRDSSKSPTKLKLPQKIFQSPMSPNDQPRPIHRLKNEDSKNLFSPIMEQDQETSNV